MPLINITPSDIVPIKNPASQERLRRYRVSRYKSFMVARGNREFRFCVFGTGCTKFSVDLKRCYNELNRWLTSNKIEYMAAYEVGKGGFLHAHYLLCLPIGYYFKYSDAHKLWVDIFNKYSREAYFELAAQRIGCDVSAFSSKEEAFSALEKLGKLKESEIRDRKIGAYFKAEEIYEKDIVQQIRPLHDMIFNSNGKISIDNNIEITGKLANYCSKSLAEYNSKAAAVVNQGCRTFACTKGLKQDLDIHRASEFLRIIKTAYKVVSGKGCIYLPVPASVVRRAIMEKLSPSVSCENGVGCIDISGAGTAKLFLADLLFKGWNIPLECCKTDILKDRAMIQDSIISKITADLREEEFKKRAAYFSIRNRYDLLTAGCIDIHPKTCQLLMDDRQKELFNFEMNIHNLKLDNAEKMKKRGVSVPRNLNPSIIFGIDPRYNK